MNFKCLAIATAIWDIPRGHPGQHHGLGPPSAPVEAHSRHARMHGVGHAHVWNDNLLMLIMVNDGYCNGDSDKSKEL